jgi:hypothetical protein
MSDPIAVRRVPAHRLREIFNEKQYLERVERGELRAHVLKEGHARRASGEPWCTASQYVAYYDAEGRKVAEVHQYRRQDGSIGGSGRPDPKRILMDDEIWLVDPSVDPGRS